MKKKTLLAFLLSLLLVFSASSVAFGFGKGAKGPDVYAVQGMLKSLGYFGGTITGYYGTQTESGVRSFQKHYGLPVTGAVDDRTLESILWAYGNLKIPKAPAPVPGPTKSPATPAPSAQPPTSSVLTDEEARMVELVNGERIKAGLSPLQVDPALVKMARIKSQDMVAGNYFSHQSPTYGSPFDMMAKFGISYSSAGENIACNQTVDAAHVALMNSPGHRANILGSSYAYIGIGIVNGGPCGKMFTQEFVGR